MKLDEVLARATDTKALRIGDGILPEAVNLFKTMFPDKRPIVVADVTTFEIAGRELQNRFVEAGLNPDKPFIFDEPHFHAEWKFVEMLDAVLEKTDAIPVAVGSGTINDLNKLSSYHNNRRYMTVATAASMDGYTAFGASITKDGAKQTFSCPAPLAVLADTAIISKAPAKMTASGYADLFAKVPAGADWILADALGVEPLDEFSFGVVQGGLKNALGNPEALCSGDKTAMHNLIEGLILGGFAMQAHKSSRPASGADHQFSHLWNMEHHEMADGTVPSHGFQVSIGMLMSSALYSCMLDEDFSKLDVDACVAAWPSLEDAKAEALKMFEGTDFPTIGATEVEAKYVDKDGLRKQLTTLRDNWHEISAKLKAQIIPVEQAKRMLAAVGAPTEPEQIGISKERLRNSAIRAEKIRRRFTILDVAVRTGKLNDWLDKIFSHPKRNLHSGFAKVSSAESCIRQSIHH